MTSSRNQFFCRDMGLAVVFSCDEWSAEISLSTMCRVDGHGESGEAVDKKTMMCVFSISDLFHLLSKTQGLP